MEGFKKLPKMQCFKEGGQVAKKMCGGGKSYKEGGHLEKKEMAKDLAQDKKVVKKAIALHDKQEHAGEHTDLSSLKRGGRAKKEQGTVKKYKTGGGVYGAKKTAEDKKAIAAIKRTVPAKAASKGPVFADGGTPDIAVADGSARGRAQTGVPLGRVAENAAQQPGLSGGVYKDGGDVHVHHHYPA